MIRALQLALSAGCVDGRVLLLNSKGTGTVDEVDEIQIAGNCEETALLKFLGCGIVANQIFKDCQDVLAVADDGLEYRTKLRLSHSLAVPFSENRRGNLNILSKFFGRMAAQEQAIKKSGLALRELKILQHLL